MNTLDGADLEDMQNLAEHLEREFPNDFAGDQVRALRSMTPRNQQILMRSVVTTAIGDLLRLQHRSTGTKYTLPLEVQEDLALLKTERALQGTSPKMWESIAAGKNVSVEDARKETWRAVFCAYRAFD